MATPEPRELKWTPEDYRQRPTDLDRELVNQILTRLENGETLNAICRENRDMPLPGTFLRWKDEDGEIGARYVQALAYGTECRFHEMLEVASSGRPTSTLELSALKHYTERQMPDKYGPRSTNRIVTPPPGEGNGGDDPGGIYAADAAEVRRRIEDIARRHEETRRAEEAERKGDPEVGT